MSAGGKQEAHRWDLTNDSRSPSIAVIEASKREREKKSKQRSNTPFGFSRVLNPKPETPALGEPWGGQGL